MFIVNTASSPTQITKMAQVTLVGIDGREPFPYESAEEWDASTDLYHWELGPDPGPTEAELIAGEAPAGPDVARKMAGAWSLNLPSISGGSPGSNDDAYEPTDEDLADYAAWSRTLEERGDWGDAADRRGIEEMRAWWDRNPVSAFNRVRPD